MKLKQRKISYHLAPRQISASKSRSFAGESKTANFEMNVKYTKLCTFIRD